MASLDNLYYSAFGADTSTPQKRTKPQHIPHWLRVVFTFPELVSFFWFSRTLVTSWERESWMQSTFIVYWERWLITILSGDIWSRSMTSTRTHWMLMLWKKNERISHHKRRTFMTFKLCPAFVEQSAHRSKKKKTRWKDSNKPNDSIKGHSPPLQPPVPIAQCIECHHILFVIAFLHVPLFFRRSVAKFMHEEQHLPMPAESQNYKLQFVWILLCLRIS